MRAVISVVGKDRPGILAFVATQCADSGINIVDVTQTILQDMFTMIMMVEIPEQKDLFSSFSSVLKQRGQSEGLVIHVMHEDIFNAMHKITENGL